MKYQLPSAQAEDFLFGCTFTYLFSISYNFTRTLKDGSNFSIFSRSDHRFSCDKFIIGIN